MNLIHFRPEWQNTGPAPSHRTGAVIHPNSRMPIIVAEDNVVSRALLVAILRKASYEPIETANGADAMAALRLQSNPCLAIIDWMMPEMDGAEMCRRLRASGKAVHIIMLTSRASKENAVEGLDAGADDYLVKPFDHAELLARVRAGIRALDIQARLLQHAKELEMVALAGKRPKLQLPL